MPTSKEYRDEAARELIEWIHSRIKNSLYVDIWPGSIAHHLVLKYMGVPEEQWPTEKKRPQPEGEPSGEGPYTDNGKKLSAFEYKIFGPGVDEIMLHLQLTGLKPEAQVLALLNFGWIEGRREGQRQATMTEEKTPPIICLCGSTRFMESFQAANLKFTLMGFIVLSVGCNTKTDSDLKITEGMKAQLDELHKRKIDLAQEVFILNVGGYIGESTRSELEYAKKHGKVIHYLEPVAQADKEKK